MEFREKQIESFIEQTREISKTIGMVPSPRTGNMVEEDEYISGIIDEVQERLIDLSSARITILNYLNQQVDSGNGEAFNRMREEFLKISTWVRNIEIEVLGRPAVDETSINPDTDKPIVDANVLQEVVEQHFPPGFRAFTGAEEAAIKAMQEKVEEEKAAQETTEYDPYHKFEDQSEDEWVKRLDAKEQEATMYSIASYIAANNPLFTNDLISLIDIVIFKKLTSLVNENFIRRINELMADDSVEVPDATSIRVAVLMVANNLFAKEFELGSVDFSTRKLMTLSSDVLGSSVTFRPADMKECIQYVFLKMTALRPLTETDIGVLSKFIELNKDKEEDIDHIHGALNGMAQLYAFTNFTDSAIMISTEMDKLFQSEPSTPVETPVESTEANEDVG